MCIQTKRDFFEIAATIVLPLSAFGFQHFPLQECKQKPDLAGFKPRAAALITSAATEGQKAKQLSMPQKPKCVY